MGEEEIRWCGSVDPRDGHPLAGGADHVDGLLQVPDGLVDLIVDDGLVKVVSVRLLQDLGLLLQPLEGLVLSGTRGGSQGVSGLCSILPSDTLKHSCCVNGFK